MKLLPIQTNGTPHCVSTKQLTTTINVPLSSILLKTNFMSENSNSKQFDGWNQYLYMKFQVLVEVVLTKKSLFFKRLYGIAINCQKKATDTSMISVFLFSTQLSFCSPKQLRPEVIPSKW